MTTLKVFFVVAIIAVCYFAMHDPINSKGISRKIEHSVKHARNKKNTLKQQDLNHASQNAYKQRRNETSLNTIITNSEPAKVPDLDYSKLGLTKSGAKIMQEKNPKKTIKISDYANPHERKELLEALEVRKKLKYLDLDEKDADIMYNSKDIMHQGLPELSTLDFTPSDLPGNFGDYFYIGYIEDLNKKYYSSDRKLPMVRKIFERNDGSMLILDEETLKNGAEIAIEEFVSTRINGYPAHVFDLKSPKSKRKAIYLKVATEKSQYIMHFIGDNINSDDDKQLLISVAEDIIQHNT